MGERADSKTSYYNYSKMTSTASYNISIADDVVQAEARALSGEKKGDFRVKARHSGAFTMELIQQHIKDYYQRILNEVKRGERVLEKLDSWKAVEKASDRFLMERIADNLAKFKSYNMKRGEPKMSLIPCSFIAPHSTLAEDEAYMARWNDDGNLHTVVMAICRKHTNDEIILMPQVVHTADPKSPTMVCLVLIAY